MVAACFGSGETQPLTGEPIKKLAMLATTFACLSGWLLGYDIGITNGMLEPVAKGFNMSHRQMQIFVGILNMMALPGCIFAGWSADYFGRRPTIAAGAALFFVGNSLMALTQSFVLLVVGRAIAGFAMGLTLVTEPLYTAEMSPARLRGMLSTNVEVSFNVGILFGFIASWAFEDFDDDVSWRYMLGLSLIAPVASLFGVFAVLPESPRWLASQGRLHEAEATLNQLLGPNEAKRAIMAMQSSHSGGLDKCVEKTLAEAMACPKMRWLFFIGGGVAFFSQATGIESIMYYSGVILERGGLARRDMLMGMVGVGICKLIAIVVSGQIVDRVGRRPLLMLSSLGMSMSMQILGVSFVFSWGWSSKLVAIIAFVVLFSMGYGPIVYTLNAELFPQSCRSAGLTLGMSVARVTSAIVAVSFLSLADVLTTGGAFLFFAVWGLAAVAFVSQLVPETSGKSLEDNDDSAATM
eukprot:TRINITY_DN41502_c0_g1_i1.p1 TRINITY_DN41502_c0_g1~~TRINITY_DN41502_c0_g1_i1.p1  ORF type:complete len:466 (-),score=68.59 TRINITY_DN41502_c0_g1_i1:74-1471(-)